MSRIIECVRKIICDPLIFYYRVKKFFFSRKFAAFDKTGYIGKRGSGEGCKIIGREFIEIGKIVKIGDGSEIIVSTPDGNHTHTHLPRLIFGDDVRITARIRLTCAQSIQIGNHVLIAPDVYITDHNHGRDPLDEMGYARQPLDVRPVIIEDCVWLGQRVCVMPGVTIGAHSIIGANSVVTHDIPAYCIAVGSPARVVKRWNFEENQWEKV